MFKMKKPKDNKVPNDIKMTFSEDNKGLAISKFLNFWTEKDKEYADLK
jgi:hypothetical protein